jgi:formate hydrogenlyase transcriptional activator
MNEPRVRGFSAVLSIIHATAGMRDRARLFPAIAHAAKSVIPCDIVGFTVGRLEGDQLAFLHSDPPMILKSFDIRDYRRPATVWRGHGCATQRFEDLADWPVHRALWGEYDIRESFSAPMLVEDVRVGAVMFWSRRYGTFDRVDHEVACELATACAIAIESCLAYEHAAALRDADDDDNSALREAVAARGSSELIAGTSNAFATVREQIAMVAPTRATVLLTGESGSGKDMVARAIHEASPRRDRPMVTVNCAALPGRLAESELFGHEEGAFTGAARARAGRFELAQGTTLFLDEIGELSLEVQAKLLRVLQEREVLRVGGNEAIPVDVRIIAATNRDLREMIADGRFREDLYYRIAVFPLHLPPLRARLGDLPALVESFVDRCAARLRVPRRRVTPEAMRRLAAYPWPGNVRELQNAIERAMIVSTGAELDVDLVLPRGFTAPAAINASDTLRAEYVAALEASNWVIEGAAGAGARLGIHPNTLRHRLKKLGIERPIRNPSSS